MEKECSIGRYVELSGFQEIPCSTTILKLFAKQNWNSHERGLCLQAVIKYIILRKKQTLSQARFVLHSLEIQWKLQ